MYIYILGSAAGGGFPQWNCSCEHCVAVRDDNVNYKARTQSSIAISENGQDWVLCNASPDIRQQLYDFKEIHLKQQIRGLAIRSIILMDSQLDHTIGLLSLREGCPLDVWCTQMVYQDLTTHFPVFNILKHWNGGLKHHLIDLQQSFQVDGFSHLYFQPIVIRSAAPPYSPHRDDAHDGDNIALVIRDLTTDKQLFYAPGLKEISVELIKIMQDSDCILIDGTFWTNDELLQLGISQKKAQDMGHLYISGEDGSLNFLKSFQHARKILIHINNTNPILNEASSAYECLKEQNIEVAFDGMKIEL